MDLMTKAANQPIHNRLSALADELGETAYDLALVELRRYQTALRTTREELARVLQRDGVDWDADAAGGSAYYRTVSL